MGPFLRRVAYIGAACATVICLSFLSTSSVHAAPFVVSTCSNSGAGSLPDAVAASNTVMGTNTITFTAGLNCSGAGTIVLTGSLTLSANVTIDGTGATIVVDGSSHGSVFVVNSGVTATLNDLTIQHGSGTSISPCSTLCGGGIYNQGTLTVTNSTIANNAVLDSGGGIFNAVATLTVTNSTFTSNSSQVNGGGISNLSGILTVTNSTFTSNSSQFSGGGIGIVVGNLTVTNSTFTGNASTSGGGINVAEGTATVTNSTLSGNSATAFGGGIRSVKIAAVTLTNTIVAGSSATGGDLLALGGGTLAGTNNLIDDTTGTAVGLSGAPTNLLNTPAGLDPTGLATNGGPTQTIAILSSSAAKDAGAPVGTASGSTSVPATDQRGAPRPQGSGVDIGAYELVTSYTTVVNSAADGSVNPVLCAPGNVNTCTLRDAIAVVNGGLAGANPTIGFAIPGTGVKTITVSSALPNLAHTVTIDGTTQPGWPTTSSVVVDGNSKGSVFVVNSGMTAMLNGLTIQHGSGFSPPACGGFPCGGGIYNAGTLFVSNSTVSANGTSTDGGGIFSIGGSLTVTNSTLSGNSAGNSGGGIGNVSGAVTVTNSTLSGNSTPNTGGGIFSIGGTIMVTNSTLSGNSAGGSGGGIFTTNNAAVTLTNTILAKGASGANCFLVGGSLTVDIHDLSDDNSCGSATQRTTGQLNLLPLAANGGPTQTIALGPGSAALDFGDPTPCQTTSGPAPVNNLDQRGIARPAGACDVGAFEARFTLAVTGGSPQTTVVTQPFANPLVVTFGGPDATGPLTGVAVTFTAPLSGASATIPSSPAFTNSSGQASVTATANGTKGAYTVTASATGALSVPFALTNTAPLTSIAVTPASPTLKVGQVQQFVATGTYADNTTADLTSMVTWSSDAGSIDSVDVSGKGTGVSPGTVHIKAALGSTSGQTSVTVTPPTLVGIAPAPQPANRPANTTGVPEGTPAPSGTSRGGSTGGGAPAPVPTGR